MKHNQTAAVVAALKKRPLTYFGMIEAAGTPHAHRRALEWIERTSGWKIDKAKNAQGWTTWRVVRVKRG